MFRIFLYVYPVNPPTSTLTTTLTTTLTPPAAAVVPCAHADHQRPATVPSGGQMEMDGSEGDYVIYIYINHNIYLFYYITLSIALYIYTYHHIYLSTILLHIYIYTYTYYLCLYTLYVKMILSHNWGIVCKIYDWCITMRPWSWDLTNQHDDFDPWCVSGSWYEMFTPTGPANFLNYWGWPLGGSSHLVSGL